MQAAKPQISIIIEWENVKLSEMDRCREMLRAMAKQIPEYFDKQPNFSVPDPVSAAEILILYDAGAFDGGFIEDIVASEIPKTTRHCEWRIIAAGSEGYYGLKNIGSRQAQGDVLVFIDSDLIPEEKWLENMLSPMQDPSVKVVAGHAYVTPDDMMSRTFALTWFFPLRAPEAKISPANGFFANSVAFRRDVFLAHPYEVIPGASRGACRLLAKKLAAQGVQMLSNTGAQASHPPPNGLKHFLMRAVVQGRDDLLMNQTEQRTGKGTIFHSIARIGKWQLKALRRILFQHQTVGMPFYQVPFAMFIASIYGFLFFMGDVATRIFPARMKAGLHI
jgi:hypothetical protein